jgi:rhodanese-related sulfurtransferase
MKRLFFLGAVSAALFAVGLVCAASPQIYVTQVRYNFGLAIDGDIVLHTFVFQNVGDAPLAVIDVISECGCTVGEVSGNPIAPGTAGELVVTFHTAGYGDESVLKVISMVTDDPAVPVATFELAGRVIRRDAVLLDPANLAGRLFLVFDLRDWDSYAAGHLIGAVHLPAADAAAWLEEFPSDAAVLFYDQDGAVSAQLAAHWVVAGHTGVRSLAGGLDEWIRQFGNRMVSTALPLIVAPDAAP